MQAFFVVLNMPGNGCNIYVLDCTGSDFSRAETLGVFAGRSACIGPSSAF